MTTVAMVQCDKCGKLATMDEAYTGGAWGCYNCDGSLRKGRDEALDKPSIDLCPACNDSNTLTLLVYGEPE